MNLISYNEGLNKLLSSIPRKTKVTQVPLLESIGRVLATPIVAQFDSPAFDNSAMDGYAICGLKQNSWQLVDYVAAGNSTKNIHLQPGQATRIFTGAAVPQGTQAVLIQENTQVDGTTIRTEKPIKAMQNIRLQAEEYVKGAELLPAQHVLNSASVGLIACQGLSHAPCFEKLRVTVIATGNELQALGQPLGENQIYDSNRYMLLTALQSHAFDLFDGGTIADDFEVTKRHLSKAAKQSDVVLISGGASVGDKDFGKRAIAELGTLTHWKLAIKPGKPFGWGQVDDAQIFIIPGNPVASWVTFCIMVLPALKFMTGMKKETALPLSLKAIADFTLDKTESREVFYRGMVRQEHMQLKANIFQGQGSAMLANCAYSNALVVVPANTTVQMGQELQIILLEDNWTD